MRFVGFEFNLFELVAFNQFRKDFILESFTDGIHLFKVSLIRMGLMFLFLQLMFEQRNPLGQALYLMGFWIFSVLRSHVVDFSRLLIQFVHIE